MNNIIFLLVPITVFVLFVWWLARIRIKKKERDREKLSAEARAVADERLLKNTGNFLTSVLPIAALISLKNSFGWDFAIGASVAVFILGRIIFSFIQKRWER